MPKEALYENLKLTGMVIFIPIVLALGPTAGFIVGDYLRRTFGMPYWAAVVLILLGFIGGLYDTVRIVRKIRKIIG